MTNSKNDYPRLIAWITHAKAQAVFALLALCVILVFDASALIFRPYDGLDFGGYRGNEVLAVDKGGPAEKAGLLPGDLILTIDGKPVDRWRSSPLYRPNLGAGATVVYQVQRGEQILTIPAVMGARFENASRVGQMAAVQILSILFWVVGFVLCVFVLPGDVRARLTGLVWLLVGVAIASGGPAGESYFWGSATTMKISWAVLGPLLITQHLFFPTSAFAPRTQNRMIWALAIISTFLIAVTLIDDVVFKALFSLYTGLNNLVYGFFLIAVVVSIGLLVRSRWLIDNLDTRRQAGIVIWGMVLGLFPFLLLSMVPNIARLLGMKYYASHGAYTTLFLVLIPLSYAYVIYQRKLLKIDFIINRLIVSFVIGVMILTVSFLTLMAVGAFLDLPSLVPLVGSALAVVVALPASALRDQANHWVNRALYGAHYDHASIVGGLSTHLAQALDRTTLASLLRDDLARQMGIQQTALFLTDGNQLRLQEQNEGETLAVSLNDELLLTLLEAKAPMRAQNLWGPLPETVRERWRRFTWGEIFVPIIFENQLQGVLILGSRIAGDVYSAQDVLIIATVAQQGALASTNVQLVETLRGLSQQLVRASEEERKRIARELHDGVLQNLFFIKGQIRQNTELVGELDEIITRLRQTIKAQRPSGLDRGLDPALLDLVTDMRRVAGENGPQIMWHNQAGDLILPDEQAISIYRIAQEAIANALRHAQAHYIAISLTRQENMLILTIEDDGVGMPPAHPPEDHYGLIGMHERALWIGASLRVTSNREEGTTVILEYKIC